MALIFGKKYTRDELRKRVGDMSQLACVKRHELAEGNEKGVEAIDFSTGSGLNFTVLAGRGMDISSAYHNGRSLCWRSETGDVHAAYFEPDGLGWLRGFYGGLLATCGLTYAGAPCEDEGRKLGLHGRVSYIPAKQVHAGGEWDKDDYVIFAEGTVREAAVFGENIVLRRRIWARMGESRLFIEDTVENEGFSDTPHMMIYHMNFGFPVLDDGSVLLAPSNKVIPRDDEARDGEREYNRSCPPVPGFREKVYLHAMGSDRKGSVLVSLVNERFNAGEGFGIYFRYQKKELPRFTQWKMTGEGTYVMGLEPCNCSVLGRNVDRRDGSLAFLKPGEKREYHIEIGVVEGKKQTAELKKQIKAMH